MVGCPHTIAGSRPARFQLPVNQDSLCLWGYRMRRLFLCLLFVGASFTATATADDAKGQASKRDRNEADAVSFQQRDGSLSIAIGGKPVAEYVFRDDQILRPYFRHLRTLSGELVTRHQPPVRGQDLDDHAAMHPGLWLAFGDLDGFDFWRNKGRVRQLRFMEQPKVEAGGGSFVVENVYEADGRLLCTETCRIAIGVRPDSYLVDWRSTFQSTQDFTFGDQEEMGLGVRVATPLIVQKGGEIIDSESRKNGAQVWGKQADWCQYHGVVDRQRIGIVVMPSPNNFRRSWFHARDYGLLVANPFGQNAFDKGEKSKVTVKRGDKFHLGFGVLVYGVPAETSLDIAGFYRRYLEE